MNNRVSPLVKTITVFLKTDTTLIFQIIIITIQIISTRI